MSGFSACRSRRQGESDGLPGTGYLFLDAGDTPADGLFKGGIRRRSSGGNSPIPSTVEPQSSASAAGKYFPSAVIATHSRFHSLEVIFKPCPKPTWLEKTLQETKTINSLTFAYKYFKHVAASQFTTGICVHLTTPKRPGASPECSLRCRHNRCRSPRPGRKAGCRRFRGQRRVRGDAPGRSSAGIFAG